MENKNANINNISKEIFLIKYNRPLPLAQLNDFIKMSKELKIELVSF